VTALLALLLTAAAAEPSRLVALRGGSVEGRPSLAIVALGAPAEVSVWREGDDLVVLLRGATAAPELAPPPLQPPLGRVRLERTAEGIEVRVVAPAQLVYEVRRLGPGVQLVFGEARMEEARPAAAGPGLAASPAADAAETPKEVAELFRTIVPPEPEPEPAEGEAAGAALGGAKDAARDGWWVGPLQLRPSVRGDYVDAETTVTDSPEPVRDRYYQIVPTLAAELALATGRVHGSYEARFRRGSAYEQVRETSHFLSAGLELPLASVTLRATEHYSRGVLEAYEVDPGGEFFFNLGRFTRNQVGAGLRLTVGSRLDLDASGSLNRVTVAERAGFFDYETRNAGLALGYDLGGTLRASLSYGYQQTPAPPERPLVESTSQSASFNLNGELGPLLRAEISIGYTDQRSPKAGAGGTSFSGLTGSLAVDRELTRSSRIRLLGSRTTQLSAFEQNAFYVASIVQVQLQVGLPFALSGNASAGYHWNDYRTVASGLGQPRQDRIFGWSVGLGRTLTQWAYLRADYRWDRRESNLDAFDVRTHALMVQLGIGLFTTAESRR
jgi:hypothetical protein